MSSADPQPDDLAARAVMTDDDPVAPNALGPPGAEAKDAPQAAPRPPATLAEVRKLCHCRTTCLDGGADRAVLACIAAIQGLPEDFRRAAFFGVVGLPETTMEGRAKEYRHVVRGYDVCAGAAARIFGLSERTAQRIRAVGSAWDTLPALLTMPKHHVHRDAPKADATTQFFRIIESHPEWPQPRCEACKIEDAHVQIPCIFGIFTHASMLAEFKRYSEEHHLPEVSEGYFNAIWREHFSHLRPATSCSQACDFCSEAHRIPNLSAAAKQQYQRHVAFVAGELDYHRQLTLACRSSCGAQDPTRDAPEAALAMMKPQPLPGSPALQRTRVVHIIVDFSEALTLPHTPGPKSKIYHDSALKVDVLGIKYMGSGEGLVFLIHQGWGVPKGLIILVALFNFICSYCGDVKKLCITMDNCYGQLESKTLYAFNGLMTAAGFVPEIEVFYLPTGHVKAEVDGMFASLKIPIRDSTYHTVAQLRACIAANCNARLRALDYADIRPFVLSEAFEHGIEALPDTDISKTWRARCHQADPLMVTLDIEDRKGAVRGPAHAKAAPDADAAGVALVQRHAREDLPTVIGTAQQPNRLTETAAKNALRTYREQVSHEDKAAWLAIAEELKPYLPKGVHLDVDFALVARGRRTVSSFSSEFKVPTRYR